MTFSTDCLLGLRLQLLVCIVSIHKHDDSAIGSFFNVVAHHKVSGLNFSWPDTHFLTFLVNGVGVGRKWLDHSRLSDVNIILGPPGSSGHDLEAVHGNPLLLAVFLQIPKSFVVPGLFIFNQLLSAFVD